MDLARDLSESQIAQLAALSQVTRLAPNLQIRRDAFQGLRLFLVDGRVRCRHDRHEHKIDSALGLNGPIELFTEDQCDAAIVLSESDCLLLRIPVSAFEKPKEVIALEVGDIALNDFESKFLAELYELISSDRLELPSRPEVALKIQKLTEDPEIGIHQLTQLIQSDATLAGALMHATNSPYFRGDSEISSVGDAVIRLGLDNTRKLATNLALRQMFRARRTTSREAMMAVWNESAHCSVFCYALSDVLGLLNPERALLAGLIANIGAVPIIQFIDRTPEYAESIQIMDMVAKLRGIIGVMIINYWGLGEDMINVAENSNNWSYQASEPDYASITLVSRWATARQDGLECPPPDEVPAFDVLNLHLPEEHQGIVELERSTKLLKRLRWTFGLEE
jgi:HD-like signal output (HDOD) protein